MKFIIIALQVILVQSVPTGKCYKRIQVQATTSDAPIPTTVTITSSTKFGPTQSISSIKATPIIAIVQESQKPSIQPASVIQPKQAVEPKQIIQAQAQKAPQAKSPQARDAQSSLSQSTLTFYTFGAGKGFCDEQSHPDSDLVVALSTGLMNGRGSCGKKIRINFNGKSVDCTVVDKCDENGGCRPNNVDGTPGVWNALGIDMGKGVVNIDWSFI